ncbi:unnamed protein product [Chrysoparadoxa australica]
MDAQAGNKMGLFLPSLLAGFSTGYEAGARIASNSWGTSGCRYDASSILIDLFTYQHPDFLSLFAAGNDGAKGSCSVLNPGLSKNSLTVGATESGETRGVDSSEQIAFFSGKGPTYDGRIKPEIMAPGYFVLSAEASQSGTEETCAVVANAGTSMSTPLVAGAAALVREYFKKGRYAEDLDNIGACFRSAYSDLCDKNGFSPSGSVLKAIMITAGQPILDIAAEVPNAEEGWGMVNLQSVLALGNTDYGMFVRSGALTTNQDVRFTFTVEEDKPILAPLVATLTWLDPPAAVASAQQVLHDLDLVIVGPDCKIHYANNMDGLEFWDNTERITIDAVDLEPGEYTIIVIANQILMAREQEFGLVITAPSLIELGGADTDECDLQFDHLDVQEWYRPDPRAPCHPIFNECCHMLFSLVGNGLCDFFNNTPECGYDGGDCCPWTCAGRGFCGKYGYDCQDPDWEDCNFKGGDLTRIGNGLCDAEANHEGCGWDGGDCCEECCDVIQYDGVEVQGECGGYGYDCKNEDTNCNYVCNKGENCGEFSVECDEGEERVMGDDGLLYCFTPEVIEVIEEEQEIQAEAEEERYDSEDYYDAGEVYYDASEDDYSQPRPRSSRRESRDRRQSGDVDVDGEIEIEDGESELEIQAEGEEVSCSLRDCGQHHIAGDREHAHSGGSLPSPPLALLLTVALAATALI